MLRRPKRNGRDDFLYKEKPAQNGRLQMMVTGYSHTVHGLKLGEIMHKNMHLLPEHLRGQFILAYRAAPK